MTVTITHIAYSKGSIVVDATIQRLGAVVNLTGKTVTCTVRNANDFDTTLSLDDQPVTVTDDVNGLVQFSFAGTGVSGNDNWPMRGMPHLLQFRVVEDDYYPEGVILPIRDSV